MSDRNWEAELAKIDKQLASVSDEQLLAPAPAPATGRAPTATGKAPAPAAAPRSAAAAGGSWRSWLKVSIAVAGAAGLMFWPWAARCGLPLIGFTAATGGVAALGVWSAVGTWRHRLGLAHIASVLVTAWGIALGAREVLPRVGYAIPTLERPGQWSCEGLPQLPPAPQVPQGTSPQGTTPQGTAPEGTTPVPSEQTPPPAAQSGFTTPIGSATPSA